MDVPVQEIKAIAETLPIGIYAKRRVPVSIVEGEETSYYNTVTDEIVVSCDIIQRGLKMVKRTAEIETAIRSMLYHEVSHAILTPRDVRVTDWFNIFEDERIETIFQDYYLDTDFRKQLFNINGLSSIDEVPVAKSGMEKFYHVVRFGVGEPEYVDRVSKIIEKYSNITSLTDRWSTYYYLDEIKKLYKDITGEDPPMSRMMASGSMCGEPSDDEENGSGSDGEEEQSYNEDDNSSESANGESDNGEEKNGTKDGKPAHGKPRKAPLTQEQVDKIFRKVLTDGNKYIDTKLTEELSMILDNFSRKNNSGSAIASYSGTFNAKSVVRDDYKFFDRKATINGSNKFGTFHLNLFIDESGSFYRSEDVMNTLLRSLTDIERRNKNFTLDVVFCGEGERLVTDKRKRVFKANGGNRLDKKTFEIYRKLQKPSTYNYNIACFDGDAFSDGGYGDHGFAAFDHNNCTIISDLDNKRYIDHDVHSARVIYTKHYTDELIKNITDVLAKAFR